MKQVYWLVTVGKKEYKLSEKQYEFMKRENVESGRTIFWFDNFTISLPHVTSMEKVVIQETKLPELPEISQEQRLKNLARLADIKKQFN